MRETKIVQGVLGLLLGVTMILVPRVGVRAQNLTLLTPIRNALVSELQLFVLRPARHVV